MLLSSCCLRRDKVIKNMRTDLSYSSRKMKRKQAQLATCDNKQRRESDDDFFIIERKGWRKRKRTAGKNKELTARGCLALAVRQSLAGCGAARLGSALFLDVSAQTVLRSELVLAASLVARFRAISEAGLQMLTTAMAAAKVVDQPCAQVMAVSFASDATNSNIWHKSKLHNTEVSVGFLDDTAKLLTSDLLEVMPRSSIAADLQRVLSGNADRNCCAVLQD